MGYCRVVLIMVVVVLQGEFERTAPLLVFAGLSVVGGGATLLLPETKGVALPQTLAQAEAFSREAGLACCRCVRLGTRGGRGAEAE